jgi:hypothetical protein
MIACAGAAPQHDQAALQTLVRGLSWHALPYGGGLTFPGDQLLRLSMDFATGTAGVLFALGAALHDVPVRLPFLAPPGGASPKNPGAKRYLSAIDNPKEV